MDKQSQRPFQYFQDIVTFETPVAYRLATCTDDVAVVEMQMRPVESGDTIAYVTRLPMVWDGSMWIARLSAADEEQKVQRVSVSDLDSFTEVELR